MAHSIPCILPFGLCPHLPWRLGSCLPGFPVLTMGTLSALRTHCPQVDPCLRDSPCLCPHPALPRRLNLLVARCPKRQGPVTLICRGRTSPQRLGHGPGAISGPAPRHRDTGAGWLPNVLSDSRACAAVYKGGMAPVEGGLASWGDRQETCWEGGCWLWERISGSRGAHEGLIL